MFTWDKLAYYNTGTGIPMMRNVEKLAYRNATKLCQRGKELFMYCHMYYPSSLACTIQCISKLMCYLLTCAMQSDADSAFW